MPPDVLAPILATFTEDDLALVENCLHEATQFNDEELHRFVLDLRRLTERHSTVDWIIALRWIYERSPCSYCRSEAFFSMTQRNSVPEDILAEALFDAESETRKLARAVER